MKDLHVVMSDATYYESHMRYPTNEKLLWESIEWTYAWIVDLCSGLKVRRPRSKYDEIRKRYLNFSRNRKKTVKKKRKLRTSLVYLLGKLDGQLDAIGEQYGKDLVLDGSYHKRRNIIRGCLPSKTKCTKPGNRCRAGS